MNKEKQQLWRERAQELGILVIAIIACDPVIEAFGPTNSSSLCIYEESAEPTPEELGMIVEKQQELRATGKANYALNKLTNSQWQYRKMSWTQGPTWNTKTGTLKEILAKL